MRDFQAARVSPAGENALQLAAPIRAIGRARFRAYILLKKSMM
jgi:hypothetical protein